ncbi:hypothetical protein CPB83DRAFT_899682 [Crepidotus variabilis]|uniref:Uncharacterized protein n=1 Tax=Crepidotus variabilis TaxID=179855 RepID=A0A9P6E4S6_9AGAR|nr:hypothetical protein CPB83DRAFT_899682 [Crepidotus variabilis]
MSLRKTKGISPGTLEAISKLSNGSSFGWGKPPSEVKVDVDFLLKELYGQQLVLEYRLEATYCQRSAIRGIIHDIEGQLTSPTTWE